MTVGLGDNAPLAAQVKIVDPVSSAYAAHINAAGALLVSNAATSSSAGLVTVTGFTSTKALTSAIIDVSAAGANVLVASSSAQTTRVHRLYFTVTSTTTITMLSGSTAMSGALSFVAGGALFLDLSSEPWYVTAAGQSFGLSLSSTSGVAGVVEYITS